MEPLGGEELSVRIPSEGRVVSRACEVGPVDAWSFLRGRSAPRTALVAPDEPMLGGAGAAATITVVGSGRFDVVRRAATTLFSEADTDGVPSVARPRLLGGFAFHDTHQPSSPWIGFPGAQFVLPAVQLTRTADETWLTVTAYDSDADPRDVETRLHTECREVRVDAAETAENEIDGDDATWVKSGEYANDADYADAGTRFLAADVPHISSEQRTTSRETWREQVERALERIEARELRKVVLAQSLDVTLGWDISVTDVLSRLSGIYPNCYRFLVEPTDQASFFGATPERLVSRRGRTVETEALAGSVGRGETRPEDDDLSTDLVESEKISHEHALVVEAIHDQLRPFAASITTGERTVRRLANVQHLRTPITTRLRDDAHVLSLVEALHPTPAVGGLPSPAAWRTITETERFDRGWYAGPVGWFDAAGDGSFVVGIRSGVATGRTATLFAGNGIVAGSDPDEEWDEVQLKYRPILDALR